MSDTNSGHEEYADPEAPEVLDQTEGQDDTQQEEQQASAPEQPRAPKMVPVGELQRERERRQALEAEVSRAREQFERSNSEMRQMMQHIGRIAQPPQPQPQMPDVNTDPVGFFRAQAEAHAREIAELRQFREQFEQQGQQQSQQTALVEAYRADAAQFAAKATDWEPAYNHFKQTVYDMAIDAGATPQQAMQELMQQEQRLVMTAMQNRRSPAETVYATAKRWGYKPADAKANGAGQFEAMQRGQAAAKTTSGGGSGRVGEPTVEQLARMTPAEFARIPPHIVDKVMGKGSSSA